MEGLINSIASVIVIVVKLGGGRRECYRALHTAATVSRLAILVYRAAFTMYRKAT